MKTIFLKNKKNTFCSFCFSKRRRPMGSHFDGRRAVKWEGGEGG